MKYIHLIAYFIVFVPCMVFGSGDHQKSAPLEEQILYYINEYRTKHHLPPLSLNQTISKEATKHSRDMAKHRIPVGHDGFQSRIQRLEQQLPFCQAGAENVAYYKINAKQLVEGWLQSPGHRRNIQGRYNITGIGIAYGKQGWAYYTEIFLRRDPIHG